MAKAHAAKNGALRLLASPLHLIIGIGLISSLLYALVLRAPYPLAEGLAHPLASWATHTTCSRCVWLRA